MSVAVALWMAQKLEGKFSNIWKLSSDLQKSYIADEWTH